MQPLTKMLLQSWNFCVCYASKKNRHCIFNGDINNDSVSIPLIFMQLPIYIILERKQKADNSGKFFVTVAVVLHP
jgi:hypothetical protein